MQILNRRISVEVKNNRANGDVQLVGRTIGAFQDNR